MSSTPSYIFEATTKEAFFFKILCELLYNNVKQGNFCITQKFITFCETDGQQTVMCDVRLRSPDFQSYFLDEKIVKEMQATEGSSAGSDTPSLKGAGETKDDQKEEKGASRAASCLGGSSDEKAPVRLIIGVKMQHLYTMTRPIKKKDTLSIAILASDPKHLVITVTNPDKQRNSTSKIKIIEVPRQLWEKPAYEYIPNATVSASEFQKMCKVMNGITKHITVKTQKRGVKFVADSNEIYDRSEVFGTWETEETGEIVDVTHIPEPGEGVERKNAKQSGLLKKFEKKLKDKDVTYCQKFPKEQLIQLAKCAGLGQNNQLKIYSKVDSEGNVQPLKISSVVGSFGTFTAYIHVEEEEADTYA